MKSEKFNASIMSDNLEDVFEQLRANHLELRGVSNNKMLNVAWLEFLNNRGITFTKTYRNGKERREMERLLNLNEIRKERDELATTLPSR